MSKVKCFACDQFGHCVGQCPNKKKKQVAASAKVEEFTHRFEKEYSLTTCLSSRASSTCIWYIDSGVSRHMIRVREYFTEFAAIRDQMVLGDDSVVRAVGCGTVSFQTESLPPMLLRDVLYVPRLKKNLVSVSTIEDRGHELLFRDGQVLLYPKGSPVTSAKVIGIRHEKLYKLMF
jgi:hypothetical protein